jgi:NAD-dependent deacetylase
MAEYKNIVVLTGAGISAESGLKTFRDNDGLWENHPVEDVATPEAFAANPDLVYRFYNERREQLQTPLVKPNSAHFALAELEKKWPENVLIVTQNVDNLHERAGSERVLHMHGELLSARCCHSEIAFEMRNAFDQHSRCNCCENPAPLRPDIVWFGEMPKFMDDIQRAIYDADLLISIGTSGHVYPAAGFGQLAQEFGLHTVELNLAPSQVQSSYAECYYGPATEVVPSYVAKLIATIG